MDRCNEVRSVDFDIPHNNLTTHSVISKAVSHSQDSGVVQPFHPTGGSLSVDTESNPSVPSADSIKSSCPVSLLGSSSISCHLRNDCSTDRRSQVEYACLKRRVSVRIHRLPARVLEELRTSGSHRLIGYPCSSAKNSTSERFDFTDSSGSSSHSKKRRKDISERNLPSFRKNAQIPKPSRNLTRSESVKSMKLSVKKSSKPKYNRIDSEPSTSKMETKCFSSNEQRCISPESERPVSVSSTNVSNSIVDPSSCLPSFSQKSAAQSCLLNESTPDRGETATNSFSNDGQDHSQDMSKYDSVFDSWCAFDLSDMTDPLVADHCCPHFGAALSTSGDHADDLSLDCSAPPETANVEKFSLNHLPDLCDDLMISSVFSMASTSVIDANTSSENFVGSAFDTLDNLFGDNFQSSTSLEVDESVFLERNDSSGGLVSSEQTQSLNIDVPSSDICQPPVSCFAGLVPTVPTSCDEHHSVEIFSKSGSNASVSDGGATMHSDSNPLADTLVNYDVSEQSECVPEEPNSIVEGDSFVPNDEMVNRKDSDIVSDGQVESEMSLADCHLVDYYIERFGIRQCQVVLQDIKYKELPQNKPTEVSVCPENSSQTPSSPYKRDRKENILNTPKYSSHKEKRRKELLDQSRSESASRIRSSPPEISTILPKDLVTPASVTNFRIPKKIIEKNSHLPNRNFSKRSQFHDEQKYRPRGYRHLHEQSLDVHDSSSPDQKLHCHVDNRHPEHKYGQRSFHSSSRKSSGNDWNLSGRSYSDLDSHGLERKSVKSNEHRQFDASLRGDPDHFRPDNDRRVDHQTLDRNVHRQHERGHISSRFHYSRGFSHPRSSRNSDYGRLNHFRGSRVSGFSFNDKGRDRFNDPHRSKYDNTARERSPSETDRMSDRGWVTENRRSRFTSSRRGRHSFEHHRPSASAFSQHRSRNPAKPSSQWSVRPLIEGASIEYECPVTTDTEQRVIAKSISAASLSPSDQFMNEHSHCDAGVSAADTDYSENIDHEETHKRSIPELTKLPFHLSTPHSSTTHSNQNLHSGRKSSKEVFSSAPFPVCDTDSNRSACDSVSTPEMSRSCHSSRPDGVCSSHLPDRVKDDIKSPGVTIRSLKLKALLHESSFPRDLPTVPNCSSTAGTVDGPSSASSLVQVLGLSARLKDSSGGVYPAVHAKAPTARSSIDLAHELPPQVNKCDIKVQSTSKSGGVSLRSLKMRANLFSRAPDHNC